MTNWPLLRKPRRRAQDACRRRCSLRHADAVAGTVRSELSWTGNATARLASSRCAAPPLRFGPAGDPRQSAANRFAMAVSELPALAGRCCQANPGGEPRFYNLEGWSRDTFFLQVATEVLPVRPTAKPDTLFVLKPDSSICLQHPFLTCYQSLICSRNRSSNAIRRWFQAKPPPSRHGTPAARWQHGRHRPPANPSKKSLTQPSRATH